MFCGMIKRELVVPNCPLAVGKCMWQHRRTHECCWVQKMLTVNNYCSLVGQEEVEDQALEDLKQKILLTIRKEK